MSSWSTTFSTLLTSASCDLPTDVETALNTAAEAEDAGGNAQTALRSILANVTLAREHQRPLCQDTGTVMVWIEKPAEVRQKEVAAGLHEAIRQATAKGVLRRNCVNSLNGCNEPDNVGPGNPLLYFHETEEDTVKISIMLKGGGCENVGAQYSLPETRLDAGRDMEGVRRCCLDAVWQAQGRGCAPGILGVCIGGDRATGYAASKHQLLRKIGERSRNQEIAEFEQRILSEANGLGIGPMGFGGKTTLLDVFVGSLHRVPASYFVSVSYMCWACRRVEATTNKTGNLLSFREKRK